MRDSNELLTLEFLSCTQVDPADEWLSQAVPLPTSPSRKYDPTNSGSIFPGLDDTLLDAEDENAEENPLQVSMGISGHFDRTLVLAKEDSQADMFAEDSETSADDEVKKMAAFLAKENALLQEIEKVRVV